ncbi:MAG TPA: S8 family serine peptidase, partial [Phnomibacter sp.]|nr:S8 family serine peptidase [Phnomibacter sp.]
GIAGAATNNDIGISSIGFSCKIMGLKSSNSAGSWPSTNSYNGILYAANNGAHIINMSFGGAPFSQTNLNVIEAAQAKGCILVGAAGNNNTAVQSYPAAYPGVVSVASSDINDKKSSFSNFGSWVKITAPGSSILSTIPFNAYGTLSGTSMASPMVAGLLGLMKSLNPTIPNNELIQCLYNSADNIDEQNPDMIGQLGAGRINAQKAMECVAATLTRPPLADFTATNRNIAAGGNVSYSDRSAFGPTTWSWSFPGGTPSTSNVQNPANIVYNTPGTYPVTLTVTNPYGQATETKTNYITVSPPLVCTRVNLPPPGNWDPSVYVFNQEGAGFLCGTNANNDRQLAMFFDVSATNNTTFTSFGIVFTHANGPDLNKLVTFRVYDGTNNTPGALLGSTTLTLGEIRDDVLNDDITIVDMRNNVTLPASRRFFVSVDMSALNWAGFPRDSLNILSNEIETDQSNNVWAQNLLGDWIRFDNKYSGLTGLSLYIFPFLTGTPTQAVINPLNPTVCSGVPASFNANSSIQPPGQALLWLLQGTNPNSIEDQKEISPIYNTAGTYKVYLAMQGACNEIRIDSTTVTVTASPNVIVAAAKNPICAGETTTLTATGAGSYTWSPATGLSATTGGSVQASPATTTTYLITGANGSCSSEVTFELLVSQSTANVVLEASEVAITQPTTVTFTAVPNNGGAAPTFNFRVNGVSVQNGPSNFMNRLVNVNDEVDCLMTSNEACVTIKTVTSNLIRMGETTVPVTLFSFTGRRTEQGNALTWITGSESNSDRFVIERSRDGQIFAQVGQVAAAGNSATNRNYNFVDRQAPEGKNYYRLKMVDKDGTFRYSNVVMIDGNGRILMTRVQPNPTARGGQALLVIGNADRGPADIVVSNVAGQVMRSYRIHNTTGSMQVPLSSHGLAEGTYLITYRNSSGETVETIRWIVIR